MNKTEYLLIWLFSKKVKIYASTIQEGIDKIPLYTKKWTTYTIVVKQEA